MKNMVTLSTKRELDIMWPQGCNHMEFTQTNQQKLFNYACKMLAHRRYSTAELKKKLIQKYRNETAENCSAEIEKIILCLQELRYLDDEQYVQAFVEDKIARKPQGLKLMKYNLAQKGLPSEVVQHALAMKNIDEVELACAAAKKKLKSLCGLPAAKQKEKLCRFLLSRGFALATIYKALEAGIDDVAAGDI